MPDTCGSTQCGTCKSLERNEDCGVCRSLRGYDPTAKPSNPKDIVGSNKLPLSLFPATAIAEGSLGFLNGQCKYGRDNFLVIGIRASIYVDAALRHLLAWYAGREVDPEDGVPDLGAALACIAIIVDSRAAGTMVDDRRVANGYLQRIAELTPEVERIKELHAHRDPRHYTIADNAEVGQ